MRPFTFLFLFSILIHLSLSTKRGVSPEDIHYYKDGQPFTCRDGSATINFAKVNDDYCDCQDGSDEPGTSACSPLGTFYCANKGYKSEKIPSSSVNDGICDCCDGTDEYSSRAQCGNTCIEQGVAARKALEEKIAKHKEGSEVREKHIVESAQKLKEKEEQLASLEQQLNSLENSLKEEQEKKDSVKDIKKLLEKLIKKDEEEVKKAEEEARKAEEEANQTNNNEEQNNEVENEIDEESEDEKIDDDVEIPNIDEKDTKDIDEHEDVTPALDEDDTITEDEDFPDDEVEDLVDDVDVKIPKVKPTSPPRFTPPSSRSDDSISDEEIENFRSRLLNEGRDPKKYLEEIREIEEKFRSVEREKREMDRKVRDLRDTLDIDFGDQNQFYYLYDNEYSFNSNGYTYKFQPFSKVTQGHTNLGKWGEWTQTKEGLVMKYINGEKCWGGPNRETTVSLVCGPEDKILKVEEPNRCIYTMLFETSAVCDRNKVAGFILEQQSEDIY